MNQKDAVFSAVTSVICDSGADFEVGTTDAAAILNKQLRAKINDLLIKQFSINEVAISADAKVKLSNMSELRAYVSGLVSNWMRKDPRLNGGKKESLPQRKVSIRTGNTDPQVRAMRLLLKSQTDETKRAEIQGFIDKRLAEVAPVV